MAAIDRTQVDSSRGQARRDRGTEPAVTVTDVVKQYRVRHEKGRTLKELFLRQNVYEETINALNHVNLEIPRGKTVGIIGSNGSGKSTILKLIAGTSQPTSGRVEVRGRVSALLELGAGFHPDFTGRENIYLDGAIMGLPRKVVDERFDEIVAFAEMQEFIDAPAKTYSSGMYLRLAFAVAVNVDPDIILIDEVFAVGDASFQRKCLERMDGFKSEGKTIVFVTHALASVQTFCDEAVWLEKGVLRSQGPTEMVIDQYMWEVNQREESRLKTEQDTGGEDSRWGTKVAEITSVRVEAADGADRHIFSTGDSMRIQVDYRAHESMPEPVLGFSIQRTDGVQVFGTNTLARAASPKDVIEKGVHSVTIEIDRMQLLPGSYQLSLMLTNRDNNETFDFLDRRHPFRIIAGPDYEVGVTHMAVEWTGWGEPAS